MATVRRIRTPYGKETAMDTTVTRIVADVVAELRMAGHAHCLRAGRTQLPGLLGITRDLLPGLRRWRQRSGVLGIVVGQVGEVLLVLGGVELPSVLEVHRPHRPCGRGQPGRREAFSCDLAGAQRRG